MGDHIYDDCEDEDCNECGDIRITWGHSYDYICDTHCKDCGKIFSDDAGKNGIEDIATLKAEHIEGEPEIVPAEIGKAGSKTVKCATCGEVLSSKEIPALKAESSTTPQTPEKIHHRKLPIYRKPVKAAALPHGQF